MFCPNDNVTREEMAAFIVRAVTGTTTPAIYNPTPYFTDVPTTNPFFPHIQKMKELGITTGCGTGLFCPTDTIPRWEMAIFMVRARLALYGATFTTATTPYFADVPTNVEGNGVPFPFIQRSYEEHITNGCGTNPLIYCPDELVTRGQMASFIMRGLFNETTILGPTAPQVTGVSPNTMASTLGTQITVTITGVNTNFQTGDTVTVPSGMLDVSNVVVNSATSITATLTANSNVGGRAAGAGGDQRRAESDAAAGDQGRHLLILHSSEPNEFESAHRIPCVGICNRTLTGICVLSKGIMHSKRAPLSANPLIALLFFACGTLRSGPPALPPVGYS